MSSKVNVKLNIYKRKAYLKRYVLKHDLEQTENDNSLCILLLIITRYMFILIKQNIYFLLKIINIESEHIHKSIINMLAEFPVYLNSHISLVNGHDRKKIVIVLHV